MVTRYWVPKHLGMMALIVVALVRFIYRLPTTAVFYGGASNVGGGKRCLKSYRS